MTTTPTLERIPELAHSINEGPTQNDQFAAQIVALDDGRFVVLWTDNSDAAPGEAGGDDILAQVFDPFGNAAGAIVRVNDGWFLDNEGKFSVAALPGGRFVLAYEDEDIDGISIRATEVTVAANSSMSFANRTILADPGAEILADPSVSARSDGSYMVVYSKTTTETSTDAFGKVVSDLGVVGDEFPVLFGSDDVGEDNVRNDTATLVNGNYVTVHAHRIIPGSDDPGLFIRILDSTGSGVLGATEVAGTSGDGEADTRPVIAALAGGGFVVAWSNTDVDTDILFQIYDSSGAEVGSVGAVDNLGSSEKNNEPAIIGLKDGGFIIIYDDDTLGVDQIKGQRFDASGNEVGDTFIIAATDGIESEPTLKLTDDGRVVIAWREQNGLDNDVKFAIYDPRETVIDGDGANNVILARASENTLINGLGGDDTLFGRDGADTLRGGDGADSVDGGKGDDQIFGGDGNDRISGFVGNDILAGQAGDDFVQGGGGDDKVHGNGGADKVFGGGGDDKLTGSAGNDTLNGGSGHDQIFGNADNDKLIGDSGNDRLVGLAGDDQLFGGTGADTLKGGEGNDTLSGGANADLFEFESGTGDDVINGFSSAQADKIFLKGFGAAFDDFADVQAAASQVGADVVIDLGGGNSLTLVNINLGDLNAADFLFG